MQTAKIRLLLICLATVGLVLPVAAREPTLVINEVAWKGDAINSGGEWIELFNPTPGPVNLTGMTLNANSGTPAINLAGTVPAGGHFLLERGETSVPGITADLLYSGDLVNSGDVLTLRDNTAQTIDTANGNGGAWPAGASGQTMERLNPLSADSDANWATSPGTPRAKNLNTPAVVASIMDMVDPDADNDNKAIPGETIKYQIVITNPGDTPLENVEFNASIDPNTTPNEPSLEVFIPPLAVNDPNPALLPDSAPGSNPFHIGINSSLSQAAPGLMGNDARGLPEGNVLSFGGGDLGGDAGLHPAGGSTPLAGGGSISVSPDGSFSYNPPANFTGEFNFDYRIGNAAGQSDATVTIAVGQRPQANPDSYNATGNIAIEVNAANGVLNGAGADAGDQISIISNTPPTNGGTVSLSSDGSFTYDPPPGFEGTDTFTYDLINGLGTDTGTVEINVVDVIWFIDNGAGGPGNGTFSNPFNSIAGFNGSTEPGPGAFVSLAQGTAAYPDGINLDNGQTLIGQGVPLNSFFLAAPDSDPTYQSFAASDPGRPYINGPGGSGIDLASNNTIRGLDIGNTGGPGLDGNSVGSLTVSDVEINGQGQGIDLSNGTLNITLDDLSSTSSAAAGIRIQNVGGSFTISGQTTITSPSSDGIDLFNNSGANFNFGTLNSLGTTSGGGIFANNSGTVTISGNPGISTNGGPAVDISNTTISGFNFASITSSNSSRGINLDNTTGDFSVSGTTTINNPSSEGIRADNANGSFSFGNVDIIGRSDTGIDLNTVGSSSNPISFGTVDVPNPNNANGDGIRITNTAADVNISSVSISNMIRGTNENANLTDPRSIPTNDGDGNGIFLSNNTGSFTLSGGTIDGNNGDSDNGIDLRNVANVTLNGVTIDRTSDSGIQGIGVEDLTITNSIIRNFSDQSSGVGSGQSQNDSGILLRDATGTLSITNSTIGPNNNFVSTPSPAGIPNDGLEIWNQDAASLTVTLSGTTFQQLSDDGIDIRTQRSDVTLNAGGLPNPLDMNNINGRAINMEQVNDTASNGLLDLTANNNGIVNVGIGARMRVRGGGDGKFRFNNNILGGLTNDTVRILSDPGSTGFTTELDAEVTGNNFGGGGAYFSATRNADLRLDFNSNNTIGGLGINGVANNGGNLDATVDNNTAVVDVNATGFLAITTFYLQTAHSGTDACLDLLNNTLTETNSFEPVFLDQASSSTLSLPNLGGANVQTFLTGQNTLTPASVFISGTISNGPSACDSPTGL